MEESHKRETIRSIVADIRNKLTPFYNLAAMVHNYKPGNVQIEMIIKKQADVAIQVEDIIRKQLEKIPEILSEKKTFISIIPKDNVGTTDDWIWVRTKDGDSDYTLVLYKVYDPSDPDDMEALLMIRGVDHISYTGSTLDMIDELVKYKKERQEKTK